jgi:hypothetical protein
LDSIPKPDASVKESNLLRDAYLNEKSPGGGGGVKRNPGRSNLSFAPTPAPAAGDTPIDRVIGNCKVMEA